MDKAEQEQTWKKVDEMCRDLYEHYKNDPDWAALKETAKELIMKRIDNVLSGRNPPR